MSIRSSFILIFILFSQGLFARLPIVTSSNNDLMYKQILIDINENKRRIIRDVELLPLQFYRYYIKDDDSIFTIASRFNLSYETIATLNDIDNQLFFKDARKLLLPTASGLFSKEQIDPESTKVQIDRQIYYFKPNKSFTNKERLSFLVTPFKSPLTTMYITSPFGNRENPFTGLEEFHPGLDLKAIVGTKVYTPYKGTITSIGYSNFSGNYIKIKHKHGYSSYYYHLNKITITKGEEVNIGDVIALTGNTGKSTGPHLHFEIQLNDKPIDPRILLGNI